MKKWIFFKENRKKFFILFLDFIVGKLGICIFRLFIVFFIISQMQSVIKCQVNEYMQKYVIGRNEDWSWRIELWKNKEYISSWLLEVRKGL